DFHHPALPLESVRGLCGRAPGAAAPGHPVAVEEPPRLVDVLGAPRGPGAPPAPLLGALPARKPSDFHVHRNPSTISVRLRRRAGLTLASGLGGTAAD